MWDHAFGDQKDVDEWLRDVIDAPAGMVWDDIGGVVLRAARTWMYEFHARLNGAAAPPPDDWVPPGWSDDELLDAALRQYGAETVVT